MIPVSGVVYNLSPELQYPFVIFPPTPKRTEKTEPIPPNVVSSKRYFLNIPRIVAVNFEIYDYSYDKIFPPPKGEIWAKWKIFPNWQACPKVLQTLEDRYQHIYTSLRARKYEEPCRYSSGGEDIPLDYAGPLAVFQISFVDKRWILMQYIIHFPEHLGFIYTLQQIETMLKQAQVKLVAFHDSFLHGFGEISLYNNEELMVSFTANLSNDYAEIYRITPYSRISLCHFRPTAPKAFALITYYLF